MENFNHITLPGLQVLSGIHIFAYKWRLKQSYCCNAFRFGHASLNSERPNIKAIIMEFEELKDLLKNNRSYRRFDQTRSISNRTLSELVELTRYCASGRNLQPLRYRIVSEEEEKTNIYPLLKWAGYFADWDGPSEGERPAAYLVQCLDTTLTENCLCDDGLQLEAITLGATALGIHGVIIKSFNSVEISKVLSLPEHLKPLYVLALGYPAEEVLITDTDGTHDADIRYYRDESGRHIVPKRPLSELLI